MKVFWISTIAGRHIAEAVRRIRSRGIELDLILISHRDFAEERVSEHEVKNYLEWANAVLIDVRGGGRLDDILIENLKGLGSQKSVLVFLGSPALFSLGRLGSFDMSRFSKKNALSEVSATPQSILRRIKMMQKIIDLTGRLLPVGILKDARNYVLLMRYWGYACAENCYNMFLLLAKYHGHKVPKIDPPLEIAEYGIFLPEKGFFQSLHEFIKINPLSSDKPTLGILFYGGAHFEQNKDVIKHIIDVGKKEFDFIPVFTDGINNISAIREFYLSKDQPVVDAILNFMWFRINGGPFGGDALVTKNLLKALNVPVFSLCPMFLRDTKKWLESDVGLSQIEIITAVTWPELDGCIEPIPSCGLEEVSGYEVNSNELRPIHDRVERILGRIKKWCELKRLPNDRKRIAFIVYGYPPGESNIGGAAYLNTFDSVMEVMKKLKSEGYIVETPEKPLSDLFYEYGMVNSGEWIDNNITYEKCFKLHVKRYNEFFHRLPEGVKEDVIEFWGQPPGNVMTVEDYLIIPAIEFGNILVALQPARPPLKKEDVKKVAHDKTKPPHHQYLAFYFWLEEIWGANALVHVGTHGLAEFTKGKEVGMSGYCFPDILIGDMPNLYIYHVLNASEATIAKRRLYGTLISYNSPPYTTSELYEDYAELEDLIHEFNEASINDPPRSERLKGKIVQKAQAVNIDAKDFDLIHNELYKMKRTIIPKGLHVFGRKYDEDSMIQFLKLFLRYDHGSYKSAYKILRDENSLQDIFKNQQELERLDNMLDEAIEEFLKTGVLKGFTKNYFLSAEQYVELRDTIVYGTKVARCFIDNNQEIEALIRGLRAEFIEAEIGGDVIRSPEVLPTGRNIVQFDPLKIPSEGATSRGEEIAKNTLQLFFEKYKKYPETVGVILWGFETTQTQGETVGQIFHYLGVRVKKGFGFDRRLEVIPLEELKRPRIDCLVNICGFFREMFPNLMELISRAFKLVSNLEEDINLNYVRKHSLTILDSMRGEIGDNLLQKLATARIFGPPPSEYGTRMLQLIEDSIWHDEEDLSDAFISSMSHIHADNIHALPAKSLYVKHLSEVDLVSQVRSSHDYDIVDLDHYYEFFGGLSRSVQEVRGKKPEMLISNATKESIETEEVGYVITRGVRTRVLNPKWIDGMLEHGFHGAQKIADRVEILLGLSATTGQVDTKIWGDVAKRFIFDENMKKRLIDANKWAVMDILKRLLEAQRRGYWKADDEERKRLINALMEVEAFIEEGV